MYTCQVRNHSSIRTARRGSKPARMRDRANQNLQRAEFFALPIVEHF
jgi:hypothetical protein